MHSATRIIVEMRRNLAARFLLGALAISGIPLAFAGSAAEDSHQIPVMDGGAGPCSLELTVSGPDEKPVYDAKVKVHINYGFGGFHKLDLEAGTNSDGKVKFTGLPDRVHRPPLEFDASKGNLQGEVTFDPQAECQGKHDIAMTKSTAQTQ
jgi:hypothetical protein